MRPNGAHAIRRRIGRTTLRPLRLAALLAFAGCRGPGWPATQAWYAACDAEAGTRIAATVDGVDGIFYAGETWQRVRSSGRTEDTLYPTLDPWTLLDARKPRYAFVEVAVPPAGIFNYSYERPDLPAGTWRITSEQRGHPNCFRVSRHESDTATRRYAATPIPAPTARYRVDHARTFWAYESGSVFSETYVVTDKQTGAELARHAHHKLGWTRPIIPMVDKHESRSCPADEPPFDFRDALRPALPATAPPLGRRT